KLWNDLCRARCTMSEINVKLITGRTLDQGANLENKMSEEYLKAAAICEMSGRDMDTLGISEGKNVRVKTDFGEIVVSAVKNEGNPDGIAFIPMGPWANAVIGPETGGIGMPRFKGIDAKISPTEDPVPSIKELMKEYGGGK
ncbi:MAG: molybdopterin dinucleotide binding domain-containing protein, partial [Candidatus Syntropharchaeia archaeon]